MLYHPIPWPPCMVPSLFCCPLPSCTPPTYPTPPLCVSGIKGVWSLKAQETDTHDTYLVLSFVGETRVLAINAAEELDEEAIEGFDADAEV